ncbi:heparan-alpha-glucosaminide N-acetyltransferase domain-containing protein [Deinococcus marmoris]|uniref:N-acetylglucosamine related transporter, NagX n=1 Tax=Deinococcus marmoris TaxID=249408 RepID=A0A1U7NY40_9DEIO|nr:heparan-alpha-glucosaminide N-acetyltransferase domain-containing protein [Deinococcus marmoris]OLV17827.1 N-acetylglucosamine related transporter, NagX [Deinococcus marmoris]
MNSVSVTGHPVQPQVSAGIETRVKPARLTALDAWRGLTVLLMLLVNNVALGGRTPYQLVHAPFGGLTLTDLVFPWFLLCAGAALPFSLAAMTRSGVVGWLRVRRLVTRAVLLYLAGAFLTSVTIQAPTLGLGVLQLIALATLCAALLGGLRGRWQAAIAAALLLGYAAFLTLTTHPWGLGIVSETQNPVQMVNNMVLTPIGLRGLMSVIPTTALVLLGALAARPLQQRDARAPLKLLGLGLFLSAVGFGWAASGHIPFSKALWTPPYILYSAGLGILGMLAFWLIADSGRLRAGARLLAPLTIPGRNALAGYMLPILIKFWILLAWQVNWTGRSQSILASLLELSRNHLGGFAGGLVYTLGYVLAVWLGLAWMARRGLIWKL